MRLFNTYVPNSVVALILSDLALLFSSYIAAAYLVSEIDPSIWLLYEDGLGQIGFMVGGMLLGLYYQDLYADLRVRSRIYLFQQFSLVIGVGFIVQALFSYLAPQWALPTMVMTVGSGLLLVGLPAWRLVYSGVVIRAMGAQRVLFLGTSAEVRRIARRLNDRPELGLAVIGFCDDLAEEDEPPPVGRMLGGLISFRRVVEEQKPDIIVVGMSERRQRMPVYELLDLRFSGIRVEQAATMYERALGRVCLRETRPSELVFSKELGPRPGIVRFQTIYSFLFAMVGIVITLPLMLAVALLVKLTSPGPVLYRQRRVGLNERQFVLYKFRSMRADAEAATGAVWASPDDPRTTGLGRWLRKLRLDELPQLLNVLKGEMLIVGPRPERPEFVAALTEKIPFYRQRLCLKPGITGWAQINHKYGDTLEDTMTKLEYDLYYIKNVAFALDAYIIFHTLKVMLLSRGAQ